jgi:adenylate cyclase
MGLATPSQSSPPVERHLAAILAADIVGYSRLMSQDEEGTLRELKRRLAGCLSLVKNFGGKLVGTAGDGLISEFPSAVRAVQCAVSIQKAMALWNEALPDDRKMVFRIGINLGDVIQDKAQIYGDGVNVAARLEALAEPGGICLSRDARNQVRDKLAYPFADLGEHAVKNIARPVRIFGLSRAEIERLPQPELASSRKRLPIRPIAALGLLAAALAGGVLYFVMFEHTAMPPSLPATAESAASRPTIAVLPFQSLGDASGDAYFVDGLTEDVIAALGRFPELPVLSRSAVFPYKGKAVSLGDINKELGARYVVEGSVRRAPDRLRVTVQLSDASDGKLLWSDQYEAKASDVLHIQDDITRDLAGSLAVRLTKLEQSRVAAKPTTSLAAYDLVLRGRELNSRGQRLANIQARTMFEEALKRDPNCVAAYVGLGMVETAAAAWGWREDPIEAVRRAEGFASKAIGLDETDASAHALLGSVYVQSFKFDSAVAELRRAIELNPSDAGSYQDLADALLSIGDVGGGVAAAELAQHFNPNLPVSGLNTLGVGYFLAGRSDEAERVLQRALARDPDFSFALAYLAAVYASLGRLDEAKASLARARELNPTFDLDGLVSGFRRAQDKEKLVQALKQAGF